MSYTYGVVTDEHIQEVLERRGREDIQVEDLADGYLDYCTWAHDRLEDIPTFERWLIASGWLDD